MSFVPADYWPPGPPTGGAATDQAARDAAAAAQATANGAMPNTSPALVALWAQAGSTVAPAGGLKTGQVAPLVGDLAYDQGYSLDKFVPDPAERADILRVRSDGYLSAAEANAAMQACQRNGRALKIVGRALLDDTLFINPLDGAQFASAALIGEGCGYDGSAGLGAARGQSVLAISVADRPLISVNNARGVLIQDIGLKGKNVAPSSVTEPVYNTTLGSTDYTTAGCLDNIYGCHAGIDVDGFSGANPGGGLGYVNQIPKYLGTATGSANVLLRNLYIENFVDGVALNPSKFGVQNDMTLLDFVTTRICRYGITVGQSQSIGSAARQFYPQQVMCGMNGRVRGRGQGTMSSIQGGQGVFLYALIDMPLGFHTLSINDFYTESAKCLGIFGTGANSLKYPLRISGGRFAFGTGAWLPTHVMLECYAGLQVQSAAFQTRGVPIDEAFNFWGATSPDFMFDNCSLSTNAGDVTRLLLGVMKDFSGGPRVQKRSCYFKNAGQVSVLSDRQPRRFSLPPRIVADYFTREVADTAFYDYAAGVTNTYENVAFAGGTWAFGAASLTWTGTPTADMQLGQLYAWPAISRMSGTAMTVFNLKVSQVNAGTSVVFELLKQAVEYDQTANPTTLPRHVQEHANGAACTASTNSDATLTAVTLTTWLQNGDRVKLATGDPGGLIVTSGGGTASLGLNKATSATGTLVKVSFGKVQVRAAATDKF